MDYNDYKDNSESSQGKAGFMSDPDISTGLPCNDDNMDDAPAYSNYLGWYLPTYRFGHYKMCTVEIGSELNVWNELNWILLHGDNKKGHALLLAEKCVATDYFYGDPELSSSDKKGIWKNSYIREFLNDDFYSAAFTEKEKAFIVPGNEYGDKVFLLNSDEIERYLRFPNLRKGELCLVEEKDGRLETSIEPIHWWVNTEGEEENYMCVVTSKGKINMIGCNIDADFTGVRPAIWVDWAKLNSSCRRKDSVFAAQM